MRILIIEDDCQIQQYLRENLCAAGYETDVAGDAAAARVLCLGNTYDLVLLDILLPEQDGFAICKALRCSFSMPIIFMSCLDNSDSIVKALEMGGDDYLVKPFDIDILMARVKANLRRASGLQRTVPLNEEYRYAGFTLDCINHCICRDGKTEQLTALEYQILYFFVTHPEEYFSTDEVYKRIWGRDCYGDVRTVPVHIHSIRNKIESTPKEPQYLKRERGFGYIFIPDVQSPDSDHSHRHQAGL